MKKLSELGISPAPWKIRTDSSEWNASDIEGIVDKNDESVVETNFGTIGSDFELDIQGVANARLIAAAPELYESLRRLLIVAKNRMPSQPTVDELEVLVEAENALEKASGESEVEK